MAFANCKETGCRCWSLCCTLSLTGDLKGPSQGMVCEQGIMVTAGFCFSSVILCQVHWESLRPRRIQHSLSPRSSMFCERSSWPVGTVCQGNGLDAAQSFIVPEHAAHFPGTHLLSRLLFPLWHWNFVSLWRVSVFSFPASPACCYFSTPNSHGSLKTSIHALHILPAFS